MQLSIGDDVVCRLKDNCIVGPYDTYNGEEILTVIGVASCSYILYIPTTLIIKDSVVVNYYNIDNLDLEDKFLGCYVIEVPENKITRIYRKLDGMSCIRCGEFSTMAQGNQPDGSFKCFSCRKYTYR